MVQTTRDFTAGFGLENLSLEELVFDTTLDDEIRLNLIDPENNRFSDSGEFRTTALQFDWNYGFDLGLDVVIERPTLGSFSLDYPVATTISAPDAVLPNEIFTVSTGGDFFSARPVLTGETLNFGELGFDVLVGSEASGIRNISFLDTPFTDPLIEIDRTFETEGFDTQPFRLFTVELGKEVDFELIDDIELIFSTPEGEEASTPEAQRRESAPGSLDSVGVEVDTPLARVETNPLELLAKLPIPGARFLDLLTEDESVDFNFLGNPYSLEAGYAFLDLPISGGLSLVQDFQFDPSDIAVKLEIAGQEFNGFLGDSFEVTAPSDLTGPLEANLTYELGGDLDLSYALQPLGEFGYEFLSVGFDLTDESNGDKISLSAGPVAEGTLATTDFGSDGFQIANFEDVSVDPDRFGPVSTSFTIAAADPLEKEEGSLTASYTFVGNGDWSVDATSGSVSDGGVIDIAVPEGSRVETAFLYASTFNGGNNPGASFSSGTEALVLTAADFTLLGRASGSDLGGYRADITEFVRGIVGTGAADPFEVTVSNVAAGNTDGYGIAVVYSNPDADERTIAFLDGASNTAGDSFRLSFDNPVVVDTGFEALMSLGIGFSFQQSGNQSSLVDVNGQRLTTSAGGSDDGQASNGGLITFGGLGDDPANPPDPFSGVNGDPRQDDELYSLQNGGFLTTGDRSIFVETLNPSDDDNIFFAGFNISGRASISTAGNDAPVAVNDSGTGFITSRTDTIVTASVLDNDFDPEGDPISVVRVNGAETAAGTEITLPSGALLTLNEDGSFVYDPNGAFDALPAGQDTTQEFSYTISDAESEATATVTIAVNDDLPVPVLLSLSDAAVVEGDTGISNLVFTVTRSGNSGTAVDFSLTATGVSAGSGDIAGGLPQTLTGSLAAGETQTTVTIGVNGDLTPEFNETISVAFDSATAASGVDVNFGPARTGTIIDDDRPAPPPPPPVEADIFGDPHLTTLDGLGYDFQAVGEFTLLESTAGDPINVQVRTAPINDAVSINTAIATELNGTRVVIDVTRESPLTIDGVETTIDPLAGPATAGDGEVFFDSEMNAYTIVYASGEQLKIGLFDSFLNVCVFLNEARDPATVRGLLGNADGNSANDLALPDGTVLSQPVDFDTLYTTYADAWRITEDVALFDRADGETTDDFQDSSYPRAVVTLDDLPPQLVADAAAVVDAAGITDPILREAAILDVALTGNPDFADSAAELAADPTTQTEPANAPALGNAVGISAAAFTLTEGDDGETTALFDIYRIGDTSTALDVEVSVSGDVDADDIMGSLAAQTISFAADETSKSVAFAVIGDEDFEPDENLTLTLDVDPSIRDTVSIVANTATISIVNDDEGTNSAPTAIALSSTTVEENSAGGTVIGDLSTTDPDEDDTHTYRLVTNPSGIFALNGAMLVLAPDAMVDFEATPAFDLTIESSDAAGETTEETFTVSVTDANEAPTDVAVDNLTIAEDVAGGTVIGTITATDPDAGDSQTFSLSDDAGGLFAIAANTLTLAPAASLDFETDVSHDITLRVTDEGGLTFDKLFTVSVTDVVEIIRDDDNDGVLLGGPGEDELIGDEDDETFTGGPSGDIIRLGDGANTVSDTLENLAGDEIFGFGPDDQIEILGQRIAREALTVEGGSAVITADSQTFTLDGDYSGGDFMAWGDADQDTRIGFRDYLAELSESTAVDADAINGIVNQGYLHGDTASRFDVRFEADAEADYDNTIGVYEIDPDGNLVDVRIIAANTKTAGTVTVEDVDPGNALGFFLVQNGANRLDPSVLESDTLSFIGSGTERSLADGGTEVPDALTFFSHDAALNPDGLAHVLSGVSADEAGALRIGFEDLLRSEDSDDDFQDVILYVDAII